MRDWLTFLAGIADELYELFAYAKRSAQTSTVDEEYERQLAARLIRKASDEEMRRMLRGE